LSEELRGEWKILGAESVAVSIEAKGPAKKLNKFASELAANPGRYGFVFRVSRADIPADSVTRRQIVLNVDLEKLKATAEGGEPAELFIRPITGDKVYQVTLEAYVTKPAYVDLSTGISGTIPGYEYDKSIPPDTLLQVRGPASKVEGLGGTADHARLAVRLDVADFINNRTATDRKTVADLLGQERRLTTTASIVPREDIVVQQVGRPEPGGAQRVEVINQVAVELLFTREQLYVQQRGRFLVQVYEPRWLKERRGGVRLQDIELEVKLEVLASQKDLFNDDNVTVVIDIEDLTESDFEIDTSQQGRVTARPLQQPYYRLIIDPKLSFKLPEGVKPEQYVQVLTGLMLEWPT
jgi:hypothetical protein